MAYQNTTFELGLRIALYAANQTIRTLGWDNTPELAVSSVVHQVSRRPNEERYSVRYPLWNNPNRVNIVEVCIRRGLQGNWVCGDVEAYGWWQKDYPMTNGYRQQDFHIRWQKGVPVITAGTYTDLSLPTVHPSEGDLKAAVEDVREDAENSVLDHCLSCPQCADALEAIRASK